MLQTILSSYKTYLKNFPVILLFAVPLLVLSGIEIYFEGLTSANRGVKYFHIFGIVYPAVDKRGYRHRRLSALVQVSPGQSFRFP